MRLYVGLTIYLWYTCYAAINVVPRTTTDDCFENDTGFEGNDINTDGMVIETGNKYAEEFDGNSATDCQQLCQSVDNCLYFTFKNGENVKRCFLKNSDGGRMESENKISGPKNCPVDGMWSSWGEYSTCSVTCGAGTKQRTRTCTDPAPSNGGNTCAENDLETSGCNLGTCPSWIVKTFSRQATCLSGSGTCMATCSNADRHSESSLSLDECKTTAAAAGYRFIYYQPVSIQNGAQSEWCHIYRSCDSTRIPKDSGTTYAYE